MQFKRIKRQVHGVLLLDKPLGYSSNQALQKVKWLYQAAKAGHTGTLDPLATGLLPICLGEATKFAQVLTDANKTYIADIQFGVTTTTGDAEGDVLEQQDCHITHQALEAVLPSFIGQQMQTPPMYSALKVDGKPLYEYARAGEHIERQARQIEIFSLNILSGEPNRYQLEVTCSKGTYIRTLAEDIGKALGVGGVGAHLRGLRRTHTANYDLSRVMTIESLEALDMAARDALLMPVDSAIDSLPSVNLHADAAHYFKQGQAVWVSGVKHTGELRAYDAQGQFLGLAYVMDDGRVAPKRVVNLAV